MVKNAGGCKQKKQARKYIQSKSSQNRKLREPEDKSEIFAIITKICGGEHCLIKGIDNKERMCVIRKKFRGKNRRYNQIENGTWVLVGLRDWQTICEDKKEKCDLLEVYNSQDKEKLKKLKSTDYFKIFISSSSTSGHRQSNIYEDIEFVDEKTNEYSELVAKESQAQALVKKKKIEKSASESSSDEEFDFDDI
jgi:initiation factor 1A